MDQQVRRIDARFGLKLTEEEIQRIAREAEAQEKIVQALYEVDLGETRPVIGLSKRPRVVRTKRGRK
ncbi:MAG: hypothetical protein FJ145_06050 [Deltaproteobacteria bacterium]|nr:hypothetical protein [Deltaproteobacteria bacterium]